MKYLLIIILFASCKSKLSTKNYTVEHCYDLYIDASRSDSLPSYYINIDWEGKCARVVTENTLKGTKDTMYMYDNFDCPQSKGIREEMIKHNQTK